MDLSQSHIQIRTIQLGAILFWTIFWGLSFLDQFLFDPTKLWVGNDSIQEFTDVFSTVGLGSTAAFSALFLFTVIQGVAFVLFLRALIHFLTKEEKKMDTFFFWGTAFGLVAFLLFTIGDQIIGNNLHLQEHITYSAFIILT